MEARDFRDLTEAYYQVYENQELDEAEGSYGQTPKATSAYQKLYIKREETPAKKFKRKKGGKTASTERARHHLGRSQTYGYAHSGKQSDYPTHATNRKKMTSSDRAYARQNDEFTSQDLDPYGEPNKPGGMPKGKKLERQRKTGVSAESYDLYDIILSHLLDEGYAETSEAAEQMMVNMSEGWRDSILDEAQQRLFDQPPLTHKRLTSKDPKATMSPGMRADTRANELEAKGDPRAKRQRIKSKVIAGAFGSARNSR